MRMPLARLLFVFSVLACNGSFGQISSVDADRLDMEIAWQAQIQMPRAGRGVVSSHLWVDSSQIRKYAIVDLPDGRTIRVSADTPNSRGLAIGIEEAKKQAGENAARMVGKNSGFEVVELSIPLVRLVFATSDGLVQTFDAESGAMFWSSPCGLASAPAHPAAVSAAGVSIIHGRNLYLLDWNSGKQLMNKELAAGSSVALAVCNDLAYVTDFRGRLQAYGLGVKRKPWSSQIIGRAVGQPVSLADQSFCAIASKDGYVYTMIAGENPGLWTRYETSSSISGSLAAGNGAFYAGTGDGLLTKISVQDRLGGLDWDYPAGETITAPALVAGKRVVTTTEDGAIHCIDDENGLGLWAKRGMRVEQPIAFAGNAFLCSTFSGEILSFDAETGAIKGRTSPSRLKTLVRNNVSDRLYIVGENGRLQCLRARGAVLPTMFVTVTPSEAASSEGAPAAAPPTTPEPAGNSSDLFNSTSESAPAANPMDSAPSADPFGAAADDPFAPAAGAMEAPSTAPGSTEASGAGSMTDPFGAANPF